MAVPGLADTPRPEGGQERMMATVGTNNPGQTSSVRVAFRVDASLSIGSGHVMRCLTLADSLADKGAQCHFICREHPGHLIEYIRRKGYSVHVLPPCAKELFLEKQPVSTDDPPHASWLGCTWDIDAAATRAILNEGEPDWLVVDHYALDARWERALQGVCKKIMVIDDLADRAHICDQLLDQNFGRTATDYAPLVPPHCRVLAGSSHVLLRPQFSTMGKESFERQGTKEVRHILVQMGGIDQHNYTGEALTVLQGCKLPPGAQVTVVLSAEAPALDVVRQQAAATKWPTTVKVGVKDMAKLMRESDLAIGSGGGATYERIYMGLPAILRPTASNQIAPLRKMAAAGLFELYEDAADLACKVDRAVQEGVYPPPSVVGCGTDQVANDLLKRRVILRPPRKLDIRRTFHWLQDDQLRALFLMRQRPERRTHFEYWRDVLHDPRQHVFSIYKDDVHLGNAGIKNLSTENGEAELWLYLGPSRMRGKGIGRQALEELERIIRHNLAIPRAVLHVSPENDAAIRLYRCAGYVPVITDNQVPAFFEGSDVIKMEKRL